MKHCKSCGYESESGVHNCEGFKFKEQYKFSDKCPNYKNITQLQMFISSRLEDIKNINKAINEAEEKIKEFQDDRV